MHSQVKSILLIGGLSVLILTVIFLGCNKKGTDTNGTNQPPQAVELSLSLKPDTISLSWTQNNDEDFQEYRIYRSAYSSVDTTDMLIATILERDSTQYDDEDADLVYQSYYKVYVFDSEGLYAASNEVSGLPECPLTLVCSLATYVDTGSENLDLYIMGFVVGESRAYISYEREYCAHQRWQVIEITDLENPSLLSDIETGYSYMGYLYNDQYLLATQWSYTCGYIYDILNYSTPYQIGSRLFSYCSDACAQGNIICFNYQYPPSQAGRVNVYNVNNIEEPVLLDTLTLENGVGTGLFLIGDYLYILGTYGSPLTIIDVSDPSGIEVISQIELDVYLHINDYVWVKDDIAYVSHDDGLMVIDVSDPYVPCVIRNIYYDNGYGWKDLDIDYNYLYVMGDVYDLTDPTFPRKIAHLPGIYHLRGMGDYVIGCFRSDTTVGIKIYRW